VDSTVVRTSSNQSISGNKTFNDIVTISNTQGATFVFSTSNGEITLSPTSGLGSNTLTLPAATGTIALTSGTVNLSGNQTIGGIKTFSSQIRGVSSNSPGAPAYSFNGDTDTGMYRVNPNDLGFSTGGAIRFRISGSSFIQSTLNHRFANGTVGNPSITFTNSLNMGMYRIGANILGFSTASTERLRITAGGAMGLNRTPTNTQGRFEASNDIVAFASSDIRWKTNVTPIESPLQKVLQLNGVKFDWIEDIPVHGNKGHDVGVIAQEVEKVLPEIVDTRDSGMKAVKYEKLIPLLIEGIKELTKKVETLEETINQLNKLK
jgi:hypothetical protein